MEYTELKIRLMQQGAVFTRDARNNMHKGRFGHIVFEDYATTGGIVVVLDDEIYANVSVRFENTPFYIDFMDAKFILKMDGTILPVSVKIMSAPEYALNNFRLDDNNIPIRDLVMTHADRLRISPIHGCSYGCQFCTCNIQKYFPIPIETLDQAVEVALKDLYNSPRHILISGGTPKAEESTYEYLNNVYEYFPRKYPDYEFDVMLSPRGKHAGDADEKEYEDFLKYLRYDCGIATLSVNLELYNEEKRREHIPDKYKIGKEKYCKFIQKAVAVFGEGKVRSSLIVGLEGKKDTLKGVRELCSWGCIPVLSAFVPGSGTSMERYPRPEVDFLVEIVNEAESIARENKMVLGPLCKPCTHNSLTMETGTISL